jgi:hypothetical protein
MRPGARTATSNSRTVEFDRDRAGEAFELAGAIRLRTLAIVDRNAIRHNLSEMTTSNDMARIVNRQSARRQ